MGKINWSRVLLGGFLWFVVYNLVNVAAWVLFLRNEWVAALEKLGLPFKQPQEWALFFVVLTLVAGIWAIWFYAAIRPRYGPGPKTALFAGLALWVIAHLGPMLAFSQTLSFPTGMVVSTEAAGLVGIVLATLVGAWPYKE